MKKKKVIHLLNTGSYSGAENVVINIMSNMKQDVDMVYVSPDGDIRQILEDHGLTFYAINKLSYSTIRKVIKDLDPDIIHAHDFTAGMVSAIATSRIPIINHLHHNSPWLKKLGIRSILYGLASFRIHTILTVSNSIMRDFIFGRFANTKSKVVGNPINVEDIRTKAKTATLEKSSDIIFLGRLASPKNPILFLDIITQVVKVIPNLKVAMVGDGELRECVERYIIKHNLTDVVTLYGFVKNPYGLLKNSKILCLTSSWEGFGLAVTESFALGKPVVAAAVGGVVDLVDDTCGKLCYSPSHYSEHILNLLQNHDMYLKQSEAAKSKGEKLDNTQRYISCIAETYELTH